MTNKVHHYPGYPWFWVWETEDDTSNFSNLRVELYHKNSLQASSDTGTIMLSGVEGRPDSSLENKIISVYIPEEVTSNISAVEHTIQISYEVDGIMGIRGRIPVHVCYPTPGRGR